MKRCLKWVVVAAFWVSIQAAAQTSSGLRRDARLTAQDLTELRSFEEPPPGVDWRLTVGAAIFEFPLQETKRPPVGALGFTRGLTAGARDNTLEFDVSIRF